MMTTEPNHTTVGDLNGTTAVVTGSSRGFGRATALALTDRGAHVVGVARSEEPLAALRAELGHCFAYEVADVADPSLPERLIAQYKPQILVLNAGAVPPFGSLPEQTWESFSTNWQVDVAHVFHFVRAALTVPLDPGSVVLSLSSGAAVNGSPLSGGYAGAKSTIKLITSYAGLESQRTGAGIRFASVLPIISSATGLGRPYADAYAKMAGLTNEQFFANLGGVLTVKIAGASIAELIAELLVDQGPAAATYMLSARGMLPADPRPVL